MLALKALFNWIFIFGHFGFPALGATGCGIARACAGWITAIIAYLWWTKGRDYQPYAISRRWSQPRRDALKALLQLGLPIGATYFVEVAAMSLTALLVARLGATVSGAHQIANNLSLLCFMLPTAIGYAGCVLTGQAFGRNQMLDARRVGLQCLALGLGCNTVLAMLLTQCNTQVAAFYTKDANIQGQVANLILLAVPYQLGLGLYGLAVSLLRGYKKTTIPMMIYAIALWGIGIPSGIWLGLEQGQGLPGFWIAATIAVALAGLMATGYWWRIATSGVATQKAPVLASTTP